MERLQKNKLELYILIIVTVLLACLLIFSAIKLRMKENDSSIKFESSTIDSSSSLEKDVDEEHNSSENKEEDKTNNNVVSTSKPLENTPSSNRQDNISSDEVNEEAVVTYLRTLENESFSSKDISFKDKAKNAFVTVVDFLFYGSKIKGYTFKELTTSAKLKVIQIALSVDNKIDEYFPDYKDKIKEKMSDLKSKAVLLYLEQTAKICSNENMECELARENFKDMKKSFGFTWDLIKEGASISYDKLKVVLDEWYQSIK